MTVCAPRRVRGSLASALQRKGALLGKDLGRDKRADVLDATVVEDVGGLMSAVSRPFLRRGPMRE
jgi:hypothetical protein